MRLHPSLFLDTMLVCPHPSVSHDIMLSHPVRSSSLNRFLLEDVLDLFLGQIDVDCDVRVERNLSSVDRLELFLVHLGLIDRPRVIDE